MTVIPFDPRRRRDGLSESRSADASPADVPTADRLDAPEGFPLTSPDLRSIERRLMREAVRRIEQLEQSLVEALKENAGNWARAERAERRLRALEREHEDPDEQQEADTAN